MFGLPIQIAGTIIAAAIAAFISLVGLIISKESKVSEFRQQWIDALRAEVSLVITHTHAIHQAFDAVIHTPDQPLAWGDIRTDYVNFDEAAAKIRLRVNPTEKPSIALLEVLTEYENLLYKSVGQPDFNTLMSVSTRLLEATQVVLKQEWQRVKFGEPVYKVAEGLAGLLFIVGLVMLFKPSTVAWFTGARNDYQVIERSDTYVDKDGRAASGQSYDHDLVNLVLTHDGRKIYGQCDLRTLNKLDSNASCGLRPLRHYACVVGRDDVMNAPMPLSDLMCSDADGRRVYIYVSKEE
ncbi:MAG: hypothetical protein LAO56_02315 [Acidobacteriia bacterium]|nr:hypothetical protein [Terriglobia bacterium]